MNTHTTLKKLKEQAEQSSMKKLQLSFSTPDQFEQIQQLLNKTEKRKNIVEAQLKSAIQSHFISVSSCMEQLKSVKNDLSHTRETIYSIEDEYKTISHLETTLHDLRREAYRHKQLKSAKENMKNILDVSELSKKAHAHLEKNELLLAHKCLLELEKCRNDILVELAEQTDNLSDRNMVDLYFKEIKVIQGQISSQIKVTIDRMLTVVRKDPKQLVTALRIIEREEILDEYWLKKKAEIRFMPSDRPKKYKNKCFEQIKFLIENRVQGSRYQERDQDGSWFSKQLGNLADILVQDLEIVQKLCVPCFPPSYKVFDYFIDTIHDVLSSHIQELIDTSQLQGREYFVLLSWKDVYKSPTLMGNPRLKIDTSKLKDLLDTDMYNKVLEKHMENMKQQLPIWFTNVLEKNVSEWINPRYEPTVIDGNLFQSGLPNDLYAILIQQLQLIHLANDDRFSKALLDYLLAELSVFVSKLRDKITEFKFKHFQNPEILKNAFTIRLVTIANDCTFIGEHIFTIRSKYDKYMDSDDVGGSSDKYQALINELDSLSGLGLDFIVDDMSKCLDEQCFKLLLSRTWLEDDKIISTITATSSDYLNDLLHLKPNLGSLALYKWCIQLKVEYMKGILQNSSSLTRLFKQRCADANERKQYANKLAKEITQLEQWFKTLGNKDDKNSYDFFVLNELVKILRADDVDFLGVEIATLVKKCPEFTSELVFALLSFRGDISRADFKEKFEGYCVDESKLANTKIKSDDAVVRLKKELIIK